jgi:hypothetical protein
MIAHVRWLAPRVFAAAVIALAIGFMWRHRAWFEPEAIEAMLADHPWAPAAFIAAHVVVSLCFIPRTVMALAAGLVFGMWWGLLWTVIGAMAGAWAGFGLVRLLGGERLRFLNLPRLTPWLDRIERGGWRAVWGIRLLLPHTPVRHFLERLQHRLVPRHPAGKRGRGRDRRRRRARARQLAHQLDRAGPGRRGRPDRVASGAAPLRDYLRPKISPRKLVATAPAVMPPAVDAASLPPR